MTNGWKFEPAASAFEDARNGWDALNQACGNHILLDSAFVSNLLKHFENPDVIFARRTASADPGMALLVRKGMGRWETFQPSQAPLGLILFGYRDEGGEGLHQLTRDLPGYAMQLSVLQQDSPFSNLPAQSRRGLLERLDYIDTARITLAGTFEDYWKSRGTKFRNNVGRRRRRTLEKGLVPELIEIREPGAVAAAVQDYGVLESKGWKAGEGTSVSADNAQGRFYRALFEHFCARGEGVIYQLRLSGQLAATDLCLVRDGMVIVLKTTYDEELEEHAPSMIMREEILRGLFGHPGAHTVEFYGRVMDWHTRWSDEIRTLYHLNCFRHPWVAPLRRVAARLA